MTMYWILNHYNLQTAWDSESKLRYYSGQLQFKWNFMKFHKVHENFSGDQVINSYVHGYNLEFFSNTVFLNSKKVLNKIWTY